MLGNKIPLALSLFGMAARREKDSVAFLHTETNMVENNTAVMAYRRLPLLASECREVDG